MHWGPVCDMLCDMENNYLLLKDAREKYPQLSLMRLRQLCNTGRVEARKDKVWLISEEALKKYLASERKPGPPPGSTWKRKEKKFFS